MMKENTNNRYYKSLIAGEWVNTSEYRETHSLADNSNIGQVPMMSVVQTEEAIQSAKSAQVPWAALPVYERSNILFRAADLLEERAEEIGTIIMHEICKKRSSAIGEVKRTAELIKHVASEGKRLTGESIQGDAYPGAGKDKICTVNRVPLGVILAISPFNYPVNLSGAKIAPALVTGNAVVFKPATFGAISGLHLAKAFVDAGLPPGVLNTVIGKGSEIGDFITTHPDISMITFTGSSETGQSIAEKSGTIPMVMELGGKDAAIVFPDADLGLAAKEIIAGAFNYSGQRCTAIKRIIVDDSIAYELINHMMSHIERLSIGLPQNDADITPVITEEAADYVEELIQESLFKGAKLLSGGKREGRLIEPTLIDRVQESMRLAWEEPFGPVLPIIRFQSIEKAIEIANKSEYGLQTSVFTNNLDTAYYISDKLEVGTVQINGRTERGPDHFPFMGVKSSGMGAQGIEYSIHSMTRPKSTVFNLNQSSVQQVL